MTIKTLLNHPFWGVLGAFFARMFIYLGLPLLAWGVTDLSGFFANPVRLIYALIIFAQALYIGWLVHVSPARSSAEPHFESARLHQYMFETILLLAAFGDRRGILAWDQNQALRWLGLGFYLAGAALNLWASQTWYAHLRQPEAYPAEHPALLYTGPFKRLRYPNLSSLALYGLGLALLFRSWAALALLLALAAAIAHHSQELDREFSLRYKQAWPLRRHTTKRVIPYLY